MYDISTKILFHFLMNGVLEDSFEIIGKSSFFSFFGIRLLVPTVVHTGGGFRFATHLSVH